MKKRKGIDGKLDDIWSLLVKHKASFQCEYCHNEGRLNSHHIYSRSNASVRWDTENGICLCISHHTFSSGFSAHKTPLDFIDWLTEYQGQDRINALRLKANSQKKWRKHEKEELLEELKAELHKYE